MEVGGNTSPNLCPHLCHMEPVESTGSELSPWTPSTERELIQHLKDLESSMPFTNMSEEQRQVMSIGNCTLSPRRGLDLRNYVVSSPEAIGRSDEAITSKPRITAPSRRVEYRAPFISARNLFLTAEEEQIWRISETPLHQVPQTSNFGMTISAPCSDTTRVYQQQDQPSIWDGLPDCRHEFTFFGDPLALASPPDVKRWPGRKVRFPTESQHQQPPINQFGGMGTLDRPSSFLTTSTVGIGLQPSSSSWTGIGRGLTLGVVRPSSKAQLSVSLPTWSLDSGIQELTTLGFRPLRDDSPKSPTY